MQTIQQERAQYALKRIKSICGSNHEGEFKRHVKSLPFMIRHNGLGQAMAFCLAKQDKEQSYRDIHDLVSTWLLREGQPFSGGKDFMETLTASDMRTYMAAEAEALVLMDWVRKFAAAFLKGEEDHAE